MTVRKAITRITQQEQLNFLLTNRLPRRWLTLFVGWLSRIEQPWLARACIAIWGLFTELDLSEARGPHPAFGQKLGRAPAIQSRPFAARFARREANEPGGRPVAE